MASARISLRLDPELARELSQRADTEGRTISAELTQAVRAHLGHAAGTDRVEDLEQRVGRLEQIANID